MLESVSRLWPDRSLIHDHNLLPPVEEVEVVPLSALPQGCSDEGLLFLEGDTVVFLSSSDTKFGELDRFCFCF